MFKGIRKTSSAYYKQVYEVCVFNCFTEPNPPTDLQCPQSPLDISLEISWTAPTEPNGLVLRYQINASPGNLQIYTSSNETVKNVEGLSPGITLKQVKNYYRSVQTKIWLT